MARYEYGSKKIYHSTHDEMIKQVNDLHYTRILHVVPGIPDMTTTKHCSMIYYEIEIEDKK